MTGSATKQSMLSLRSETDCFAVLAMTFLTAAASEQAAVICPMGKSTICLSSPLSFSFEKFLAFPPGRNIFRTPRHPTPLEGRIAIVTNVGLDAMDAAASGAQRHSSEP
jgi:hypothetical protein